jgi:hypothetical protein
MLALALVACTERLKVLRCFGCVAEQINLESARTLTVYSYVKEH